MKLMRIVGSGGLSDEERAAYCSSITHNVLDSAQALIIAMRKFQIDFSFDTNKRLAHKVLNYGIDETTAFALSPEIAYAIHQLWSDPAMSRVIDEKGSEFFLMDNGPYFLDQVLRIGSRDYLPTDIDILRTHPRISQGIEETSLTIGQLSIHICNVSRQRSERRKWIHCFENVTSIIFCTALSDYDQVLLEDLSHNRMMENLMLFESLVNSRWFYDTSIILLLSKVDKFKEKLCRVPLERYFPEYMGGNDINKAAKYILWKFMQANRARLSIYPHLVRADDPTNIRLIFNDIKETILQNALKSSRIEVL
ncbi:hypothetical protein GYMLUDRAFT_50668 [Collybiopsis luxurians FD-317 M1]|uniref:Unplaced genomic scaffold GYMLUscaffold_119, whole genome shotgun sequence n=1 Tax=Collybiopsis luxurians FD-317 M1 TaxID=944289 RepID=A0A0D0C0V9_9AGAR|nr:hypothetical protein GYMLUDRAFT_50668 [Collybiopsis luxurians FD-317 M1]